MSSHEMQVAEVSISGQQEHGGEPFPLALRCETPAARLADAVAWLAAHRDELITRASRHGALLFRGFPVETAEDFDAFVGAFGLPNFPYDGSLSNAVRVNRTPRVFTANEA